MTKLVVWSQSVGLGQVPGREGEEKAVAVGMAGTSVVEGRDKPGLQKNVI